MAKKAGRPDGSTNKKYDVVEATETACLRCRSTKRSPYHARVDRMPLQSTHVNPRTGLQFNVIEFRSTQCLECGQHRRDRTEVLEERKA